MTDFPVTRQRRLRRSAGLRDMVGEARVSVSDLVYPIFVTHGSDRCVEIEPMPGVSQLSVDRLASEVGSVVDLGIPAVLLFGIPSVKDEMGSGAYADDGIVQEAIRAVKQAAPGLVVIADVCLCEYTSHGHCGVISDGGVDNDATLDLLARAAVSQAGAGADVVAPSAMMDGQVGAIRTALDGNGFAETTIMSYSAKYASAFYGPFRVAAESAPQFGDRHAYQMDHRNAREALAEIQQDLNEGADIVMVKPALSYLDVIARARQQFSCPIAAYNVSGEYSMVKAAAENEWIDGDRIMMEIATSIKRAGADILITYHAKEIARILSARP